jgi:hypothetical protein
MNRAGVLFVVLLAGALACATLALASISLGSFMRWGQSLPAGELKLFQAVLLVLCVVLPGAAIAVKRRGNRPPGEL